MHPLPDRLPLSFRFDPARLVEELERLSALTWVDHVNRRDYTGSWDVLPLRSLADAKHPLRMVYSDPVRTDYTGTEYLAASPYFQQVLARFECPLRSARLMRLKPGGEIKEHCDVDLDAELGSARLHVPITTNPSVDFYLNHTLVSMEPGSCWYLRLIDPHRVVNRGATDRVHLVIDVVVNDWLLAELRAAANQS